MPQKVLNIAFIVCLLFFTSGLYLILPTKVQAAAPGLVAEYGFNEGAGTSLADTSGSNNNGTISGAAWNAAGKYGGALSFDGVNDYVSVNDANSLDITRMTLEAWVKPSVSTSWRTVLLKQTSGNLVYALYGSTDNSFPSTEIRVSAANYETRGASQLPTNTWTHLAATYDGSNIRLYVNGAQVSSRARTGNITTSTGQLRIGGNSIWGEYLNGLIDEVRVYNRALTQTEIQTDMNTPVAPDTTPPTVSITAPLDGATVSGNSVTVSANASDNIAVSSVQFKLDGTNLGAADTTSPYSINWDTTATTNGAHQLTAVATDTSNNSTTSTIVNVTVNNPPKLTITQPTQGASVSGTTVNITYIETGDLSQANHAHFRLDGGSTLMDMDNDGSYTINNVSAGAHTLLGIIARVDHTEILGSDHTVNFTTTVPDTTPPTVSLTSPAQSATVSGTITVSADASDNVGVLGVQFLLDGANLGVEDNSAPYAVLWNTATAANEAHNLSARARDASANQTTSTPVTVTVSNTDPRAQVGEWGPLLNWPIVAVHGSLLHTGKVLVWDAWELVTTDAKLWDPQTGTFSDMPVNDQLFCSGHSSLSDGRILTTGGHNGGEVGIKDSDLFSPATNTWSAAPNMSFARWYPTNTTLSDGRVVTLSGQITSGSWADTPEIYNPATNTWSNMSVNTSSMHDSEYPLSFLLPNGKIYVIAATPGSSHLLDVSSQTWTSAGSLPMNLGSAAMYQPGKILYTGGGLNKGSGEASRTIASTIDMTSTTPSWSAASPMSYGRYEHNLVILPDGKVLAVGGANIVSQETGSGALPVEVWDPQSGSWTTLASMATTRNYHSIAILLPDGRVLSAGGGRLGGAPDKLNAQIFSPPYLFKGSRPTISSAPTVTQYGANMTIQTPNATQISSVSFIPLASVTHTIDMNQKFMNLNFTQGTGELTVQSPVSSNIAPPGYYMLFILDSNGVPSEAKIIKLNIVVDTQAPTAPSNLNATGGVGTANLTWTASTDNIGVTNYNVHRSTTSGFTPNTTNRIAQPTTASYTDPLAAGTYYYLVTAQDEAGNISLPSNEAQAIVSADTTAPLISSVSSSSITASSAAISWTTDEASDSQVEYGTTSSYGSTTALDINLVTSHSQNLTGLATNTLYHFRVKSKDGSGNLATSADFTFTTSASNPQTIIFNDHPQVDTALNGQYPTGIIDWGSNQWYISGPWLQLTTKSISFNGPGISTATFTFITPKKLTKLDLFNGGPGSATTTLSCPGQPNKLITIASNQLLTAVDTAWTNTCTSVTFSSSNGWDTNYDNLVIE